MLDSIYFDLSEVILGMLNDSYCKNISNIDYLVVGFCQIQAVICLQHNTAHTYYMIIISVVIIIIVVVVHVFCRRRCFHRCCLFIVVFIVV